MEIAAPQNKQIKAVNPGQEKWLTPVAVAPEKQRQGIVNSRSA